MKNVHLEKSLKNHMGSRKNRNFGKTDFFDFQSENVRIFSFSKIFFANVDFENRKFRKKNISQKKCGKNFHVNLTF